MSLGALYANNVLSGNGIDKYTITDYKKLDGNDTIKLASLKSKDVYIGNYDSFWSPFARLQITSFLFADKQIGLSCFGEYYFNKLYNPLNIRAGIPFYLKGKDDDTKVAFELQFKWNDILNKLYPDKTTIQKFSIGLGVGIPLGGKIY